MTFTNMAERATSMWDVTDLPRSLEGKIAIVTSADSTDGIGWHIAFILAYKGAQV
jgi:hypothetical protein